MRWLEAHVSAGTTKKRAPVQGPLGISRAEDGRLGFGGLGGGLGNGLDATALHELDD